ncbi:MAG: hypothetical protein QXR96_00435 [Candidatus Woesearchaeota archaeon]
MLFFGLITSFFGFVFLAPGAVFIKGNISNKKNAIISLAGPLSNIILAVFFISLFVFLNLYNLFQSKVIIFLMISLIKINSFFGFFNFLPFYGFDGYQIFKINKKVYIIFFSLSLIVWLYTLIFY